MPHPTRQPELERSEGAEPGGPRVLLLAALDRWIFQNLIPSLRRVCGQVYAYPLGDNMGNWHWRPWPELRRRLVDRLISDARSLARGPGLDLVMTVVYDDTLEPAEVHRLRDLGVRVVTYHVDMNLQWYRVLRHAPALDVLAISHMQNIEPMVRRGVPLHFMPMAASPDRYDPPGGHMGDAPSTGVLMLGSPNAARLESVAACAGAGIAVDVFGGGWSEQLGLAPAGSARTASPVRSTDRVANPLAKRVHDVRHYLVPRLLAEGPGMFRRRADRVAPPPASTIEAARRATIHGHAPDEQVPALLARAQAVLGVNQRSGRIGDRFGFADSRLRDFEAPLAGGFYLVQSFVDLPLFYRPGEEIETWSTLNELREKVRWFEDHPAQRAAIARAGQERARRDHTWDARLRTLLHRLGLGARRDGTPAPLEVPTNLSSSAWCADSPGCGPSSGAAAAPELQKLAGGAGA